MLRRLELPALAALLLVGAVFARSRCPEGSFDIWWHLATGRWIVEHHAIPHADPFSYTKPGAPWIAHEWATDILLYELYHRWGLYGLSLFRQIVTTASALLLFALCLVAGAHPLVAYVAGLLLIQFVGPTLNARPQILLPLLFLIALHLLMAHRRGRSSALYYLPLLGLVWANVHGGFIVLYVLIGFYALDRLLAAPQGASGAVTAGRGLGAWLSRLNWRGFGLVVLVLLATMSATVANPNGLAGATYPLQYFFGETKWHTHIIQEYASPDFSKKYMLIPGLALIGLLAMLLVSRQTPNFFEGIVLIFFTYSFLRWQRMVNIFGVVVLYSLARHLTSYFRLRYRPTPGQTKPLFVWTTLGVAVLLVAVGWPSLVPPERLVDMNRYPARAFAFAQMNGVRGHLFNIYRYGGYIIWQTYPERRVFIDGRADMYGRPHYEKYRTLLNAGPGWEQTLEEFDISWVLIDRSDTLAKVLRQRPDWHVLYADRKVVVMVRDGPPNQEVLRRWREGKLRRPGPKLLPRGYRGGG